MAGWKSRTAIAATALFTTAILTACSAPFIGGGTCSPKGGSTGPGNQVLRVVSDSQAGGGYKPKTLTITSGKSIEWGLEDTRNSHSVSGGDGRLAACPPEGGHTL